jgi:hypothetical protein
MDNRFLTEKCCICNNNFNKEIVYISKVHKYKPYHGYTSWSYSKYLCSSECLENYEKTYRCNLCHIIIYENALIKKGYDGFVYCNDIYECTIGNTTCYNIKFNNKKSKL